MCNSKQESRTSLDGTKQCNGRRRLKGPRRPTESKDLLYFEEAARLRQQPQLFGSLQTAARTLSPIVDHGLVFLEKRHEFLNYYGGLHYIPLFVYSTPGLQIPVFCKTSVPVKQLRKLFPYSGFSHPSDGPSTETGFGGTGDGAPVGRDSGNSSRLMCICRDPATSCPASELSSYYDSLSLSILQKISHQQFGSYSPLLLIGHLYPIQNNDAVPCRQPNDKKSMSFRQETALA